MSSEQVGLWIQLHIVSEKLWCYSVLVLIFKNWANQCTMLHGVMWLIVRYSIKIQHFRPGKLLYSFVLVFNIKVSIILKMIQWNHHFNKVKLSGLWTRNCATFQHSGFEFKIFLCPKMLLHGPFKKWAQNAVYININNYTTDIKNI